MNHIYRSIWNATLGCWVAAPENAHAGGKGSRSTRCASATVGDQSRAVFAVIPVVMACALASPVLGHAVPLTPVTGDETIAQGDTFTYPASSNAWIGGKGGTGGVGSTGTSGFSGGLMFPGTPGTAGAAGVLNVLGTVNLDAGSWVVGGAGGTGGTGGMGGTGGTMGMPGGIGGMGGTGGTGGSGTLNIAAGGTVTVADSAILTLGGSTGSTGATGATGAMGPAGYFGPPTIIGYDPMAVPIYGPPTIIPGGPGGPGGLGGSGGAGGSGTLNLSGNLNFLGNNSFIINPGSALNIGNATPGAATAGSITGLADITNNGVINFNQSDAAYTLGVGITGTGSVVHNAAGITTLAANSSYTGATIINAGTLVAASNDALGAGSLTVNTGGALEVSRGTSLNVSGLRFNTGSVYRVNVDPASGTSSLIKVGGTAFLAGSVVHVGNQSNAATDFQVGKTYTILTAGAINGTFDGASSNFAYLDASLGYTPTDVTLALQRKPNVDLADLSNTPNQGAAARGIESLPSTHPLYQFVQTLPVGAPAAVFASLSGDTHASVNSAMGMLGAQAPAISQNHLRSNLTAGLRAGAPIAQSDGPLPASALPSSKALPAWVEVVGNWQRFNGNGNAPGLKQNTSGLFLGGDEEVGNSGWRVGGSVGYTQSDAKVNSRDASADISSYSAAVYTGKSFAHGANRVNVLGGLAYTHHSIESERTVASLGQNLKADYSAHTAQLFAEVGYAIGQYDKQGLEPFVGITLGEQRTGSFQETGGFAALGSESNSDTLASTTLGVRAHSDFKLAGKDTRVKATLGVRHAWGSLSQNRTMAFEGSSSFTVAGAPLARNTALVGLQAEMALSRRAALVLGYNGEFGSGNRDHSANVKLRWAF